FTLFSAIFCPALLPLGISMDQGWISGGVRGLSKGMSFWDGAWRGATSAAIGGGLSIFGGASLGTGLNLLTGATEGALSGVIDAALFGDNIGKSALTGAISGLGYTFLNSEEVVNFSQGKGFNNNQQVFNKMRNEGIVTPNSNWEQNALDYFNLDATFDPNQLYGGHYHESTNKITLGINAFIGNFDRLKAIYMEELFHKMDIIKFKRIFKGDDIYFRALEEVRAKKHLYSNQGLFPNYKNDWIRVMNSYGFQGGMEPDSFKERWYHSIYEIPRRW
ncbi:hypothetical protein LJB92_04490, partial [Bacteroidales bacterium OttesenSCG-928-M06]|nr:hypothetical protein [Bacteroidales bacterium OttesenSCG-928-M06]